jgi:hypothetical protein
MNPPAAPLTAEIGRGLALTTFLEAFFFLVAIPPFLVVISVVLLPYHVIVS